MVYRFTDLDGGGEMSLEGACLDGVAEDQFNEIDAGGGGTITKVEFKAFVRGVARQKRQQE